MRFITISSLLALSACGGAPFTIGETPDGGQALAELVPDVALAEDGGASDPPDTGTPDAPSVMGDERRDPDAGSEAVQDSSTVDASAQTEAGEVEASTTPEAATPEDAALEAEPLEAAAPEAAVGRSRNARVLPVFCGQVQTDHSPFFEIDVQILEQHVDLPLLPVVLVQCGHDEPRVSFFRSGDRRNRVIVTIVDAPAVAHRPTGRPCPDELAPERRSDAGHDGSVDVEDAAE